VTLVFRKPASTLPFILALTERIGRQGNEQEEQEDGNIFNAYLQCTTAGLLLTKYSRADTVRKDRVNRCLDDMVEEGGRIE
jgi:hypothetical protein